MTDIKFNFVKDCLCFRSKDSYNRKLGVYTWICIFGIILTVLITAIHIINILR